MIPGSPVATEPVGGFGFSVLDNGWEVGRFSSLLSLTGYRHVVTTRKGPEVSVSVGDHDEAAATLSKRLGLSGIAWCRQVHGSKVLFTDRQGLAGQGDGLVTHQDGLGLMIRCADCPIILVADPVGKAVGAAHASWRATTGHIAQNLIAAMSGRFGSDPSNLIACIGPSIGPCCYEVRDDLRQSVLGALGPEADALFQGRAGKLYFDLWDANTRQLTRAGLRPTNIHCAGLCTVCNNDRFPSYRAEGYSAGRFAVVLATA